MSNTITGKIIEILPTETGTSKSGKDWKKLTFAIDTGEQYNNIIAFEVFGDEKCDNFVKYNKVDKTVDVEYNISSNKWQSKYFTSLQAWKITNANDTQTALEQGKAVIDAVFEPEDDPDLPF